MFYLRMIIGVIIGTSAIYIIKWMMDKQKPEAGDQGNAEETSKYYNTVAEVLARNNNHESAMAQAFERALDHEAELEEELARDEGLRSM